MQRFSCIMNFFMLSASQAMIVHFETLRRYGLMKKQKKWVILSETTCEKDQQNGCGNVRNASKSTLEHVEERGVTDVENVALFWTM